MRPILLLTLIACVPEAPGQETFPFSRAHRDCGPADGPAIRIQLAEDSLPADIQTQPAVPYLDLFINGSFNVVRGRRLPIESEGRGRTGTSYARYCTEHGCVVAETGEVRVTTLDESTLTGRYDLRLPDGSGLAGRFSALWIEVRFLCG